MSYKGWARGKTIELEEPLPFPEGQLVQVSVEAATAAPLPGSPQAVLEAMAEFPHLSRADVDALEAAIPAR